MAATITITGVSVPDGPGGPVRVRFGKILYDFQSVAEMITAVQAHISESQEILYWLAMARMLKSQPALGNPGVFAGKSLTIDMSAPINLVTIG